MTPSTSPESGRRSSWRRKLLFIGGGLLVLLVAAYFVVTSSVFFKGVILPRISRSLGGEVTVAEASLSPFSQVTLHRLVVKTTGSEPLLQVEEVRLRYSLFSILGGTLKVHEVTIASPVVRIVENADGTSNLDPLLKKTKSPKPKKPAPTPSKSPQVDLKDFNLKNATVQYVKLRPDGGREVAELSGVNLTLDQLGNGQPGKFTSAAAFRLTRPPNDVLETKSSGNVEFSLGADLTPQTLKARAEHEVLRAEGTLRELAGVRAVVTGDLTPTELKEFSERFLRGETVVGEVKVSGPLDLAKKEGQLKFEATSIDRQVLNLFGALFGLDFGTTTLDGTAEVSLTRGGSSIAANARFNAARLSVTKNGQSTPPLDLQLACNVTVNTASNSALVQTFVLDGTQNQRVVLRGRLSQPMPFSWGDAASSIGDSAFELAVTDLNLAEWKAFLGGAVSGGRFSLNLNLASQQSGRQLNLGVSSQIADLAARLGTTPLTQAALALKVNGQVTDLKNRKVVLNDCRLDLTRQGQPALTVSGSAGCDGAELKLQTQVEAVMLRLLGSGPAAPLTAAVKLDGTYTNQALDLRQLQLALAPTQRAPKNELNIVGRFDFTAPDVTKGSVAARADTLDLTALYNAFATAEGGETTTRTPGDSAAGGNVEPEPFKLPLQLTAEANLAQVFVREISIHDCQVTAKVDGGKITLDPCRMTLNGAPVTAGVDLDLGVKGYAYQVSLRLDKVPLEPIANTYSPANRGQYQGLILANARIKGAGLTGASMQKQLSGQAEFTFTNANLQLIGPKARLLIVPIATLLRLPEITRSPLNWLDARTELGNGNINLSRFAIQSETFEATTQGAIPIAEVLMNSPLNLPVEFALRRSLAEKANLLPPNTPTNVPYAPLPKFVTIKGRLGEPKSDLNELALSGLLLKSGVGIAGRLGVNVGERTGNLLQGVGNLLTGQAPTSTNPPATNQPATNRPPRSNPLDLLPRK